MTYAHWIRHCFKQQTFGWRWPVIGPDGTVKFPSKPRHLQSFQPFTIGFFVYVFRTVCLKHLVPSLVKLKFNLFFCSGPGPLEPPGPCPLCPPLSPALVIKIYIPQKNCWGKEQLYKICGLQQAKVFTKILNKITSEVLKIFNLTLNYSIFSFSFITVHVILVFLFFIIILMHVYSNDYKSHFQCRNSSIGLSLEGAHIIIELCLKMNQLLTRFLSYINLGFIVWV